MMYNALGEKHSFRALKCSVVINLIKISSFSLCVSACVSLLGNLCGSAGKEGSLWRDGGG